MAKRAPTDEKPYSPVRAALVDAVVRGVGEERKSTVSSEPKPEEDDRVVQMPVPPKRAARKDKEPQGMQTAPSRDRLLREKRVLLSRSEEVAVGELVQRLAACGTSGLKFSHLLRASVLLLRHAEQELVERVKRADGLVRPPNDNALALAEFEHRVAQELAAAIRASPPLR